jgi:predicted 2-oxoglutarate/Fe(II)-dependent dioxygenase YbiX
VVSSAGVATADIFTVVNALDDATCRRIQASMDAGACQPAEVLHDTIDIEEYARRATEVEVVDDVVALVESCFDARRDAIAAFFGCSLQGREGVGFLRYESGGFYGPHVDRADVPSWPDAALREITVVMFLNSSRDGDSAGDFTGGRLRLYPDGANADTRDIVPRRGLMVAFPAAMAHEVTAVSGGRRDAVIDWFY